MRPTPTLKGKSAKKFFENINDGPISEKQQNFLDECRYLLKKFEKPTAEEILETTRQTTLAEFGLTFPKKDKKKVD